ncbi:30S ribosomal protein S9 [Candidatus Roizmanbacteria bacterium RIFCSPLOWO2_01_FULL_37_12]|uniref:30S ribosomal protein S9 n=1 Tax=Candidatus Roizmanbacteria bacterium RIFCSPLOWO2_01_FULL_37_12 TaxID=1802056 RepID=A0A1F7IBV1_9BACT|nr:MAG: 30S ribosomal protein S9 [Candidatus Roizmanbacteria bacterium RIFCSPHIGHO2_01_FULL_37_16]OGK25992.1 MAG: 30S ribosomal protein S9 [Candidatus Roizmanbacteria bacterium RIFCSPHIGHO2_02_FULL_37_9b]OGK40828.1 MAG: 30S ribosomal protein S9 [Candidatus Roizmanbacteria bacterium RIFCSPLOWO2_01_FULL_37_12]
MVKKTKDLKYYEAIGRRKEAVARVRLYIVGKDKSISFDGKKVKAGEILVNKKPIDNEFPSPAEKKVYLAPLKLTQNENRFAIVILTKGGGRSGQLDAVVHGLSRAIEKVDKEAYRPILKKQGLFTRDARTRERRKVGTGGKARRAKQSPKR